VFIVRAILVCGHVSWRRKCLSLIALSGSTLIINFNLTSIGSVILYMNVGWTLGALFVSVVNRFGFAL